MLMNSMMKMKRKMKWVIKRIEWPTRQPIGARICKLRGIEYQPTVNMPSKGQDCTNQEHMCHVGGSRDSARQIDGKTRKFRDRTWFCGDGFVVIILNC